MTQDRQLVEVMEEKRKKTTKTIQKLLKQLKPNADLLKQFHTDIKTNPPNQDEMHMFKMVSQDVLQYMGFRELVRLANTSKSAYVYFNSDEGARLTLFRKKKDLLLSSQVETLKRRGERLGVAQGMCTSRINWWVPMLTVGIAGMVTTILGTLLAMYLLNKYDPAMKQETKQEYLLAGMLSLVAIEALAYFFIIRPNCFKQLGSARENVNNHLQFVETLAETLKVPSDLDKMEKGKFADEANESTPLLRMSRS